MPISSRDHLSEFLNYFRYLRALSVRIDKVHAGIEVFKMTDPFVAVIRLVKLN